MVNIKLCDIPPIITHSDIIYKLRGIVCYRRGKSKLRNSVGHYKAYVKRETNNWELFDDLQKKTIAVKDTSIVSCEFLFYTI